MVATQPCVKNGSFMMAATSVPQLSGLMKARGSAGLIHFTDDLHTYSADCQVRRICIEVTDGAVQDV